MAPVGTTWILLLCIVAMATVTLQSTCKTISRARECTTEMKIILNRTLAEDRTLEDKITLCKLRLREDNNITMCFLRSTALCDSNDEEVREANRIWDDLMTEISNFCEEECKNHQTIKTCRAIVNLDATEKGIPSEFCRTYAEGRQCLSERLDEFDCENRELLYDALFDGTYYRNYYKNVCLAKCHNLDHTVTLIQKCHPHLVGVNESNICPAHRRYTECLTKSDDQPCQEFPKLIPNIYTYDYLTNQRHCQSATCEKARFCLSQIQKQYDSALGYYIVESEVSERLQDLCMVNILGNPNTRCLEESMEECSTEPTHPIRQTWTELSSDINNLCNSKCDNVVEEVPLCYSYMDQDALLAKSWAKFCRSHDMATTCIRELDCELGSKLFRRHIQADVDDFIQKVCVQDCSAMNETLYNFEQCSPLLCTDDEDCKKYWDFMKCVKSYNCQQADSITKYLFPNLQNLEAKCKTTTSSSTRVIASWLLSSTVITLVTLISLF